MTPNEDYPRMMFHRSGLLVVINSREEEDELGPAWRRTVWPAEVAPPAEPVPEPPAASAVPESEEVHSPDWTPPRDEGGYEASAFEPAPKKPARKRR